MNFPLRPSSALVRLALLLPAGARGHLTALPAAAPLFTPGRAYAVEAREFHIDRPAARTASNGERQPIRCLSTETGYLITDDTGREQTFLESRLLTPDSIPPTPESGLHPLTDLAQWFTIPAVPTLDQVETDRYLAHLETLDALIADLEARPFSIPGTTAE